MRIYKGYMSLFRIPNEITVFVTTRIETLLVSPLFYIYIVTWTACDDDTMNPEAREKISESFTNENILPR